MEIIFWENDNGKQPVADFIESLEVKTQKKVSFILEIIEKYGTTAGSNYFDKLKNLPLYEAKIMFNKKWHRIFCKVADGKCYLVHGFLKKSNKTPRREINTALERAKQI